VDATVSAAPEQLSKNLVKLYNDLALRLMETQHDYTQALAMLHKAEAVLDNDAAWVMPPNGIQVVGMTVGSIDSGGMHYTTSDVEELGGTIDEVSERIAAKRARLRAITYNNLGCLFKRRGQPSEALGYLSSALALEQAAGNVHDCASTHLNLCASYSALGRFTEALTHAERAILLLQRHLWGGAASSFQDGVAYLSRTAAALQSAAVPLAHADRQPSVAQPPHVGASSLTTTTHPKNAHTDAPTTVSVTGTAAISTTNRAALTAALEARRRHRALIAAVTVLAMAYHNAGVEHERLLKMREAQVSYHRACVLGMRFLGAKASTTVALTRAQRAFVARRQAANGGGGVSGGGNAGAGPGHGHGQGGYGGGGHGKRGPSALVSRGSAQRLASGGSRRVGSRVNKSGAAGKGGRR
jgi:tetratricopeptide (TPR) repeat protein